MLPLQEWHWRESQTRPVGTSPSLLDVRVASEGPCSVFFKGLSNCHSEHSLPHRFKLPNTEQRCSLFSFHLILLSCKENTSKPDVNTKTTFPWLCCSSRLPVQFANSLRNLLLSPLLAFKSFFFFFVIHLNPSSKGHFLSLSVIERNQMWELFQ